jgi:hypothetical protein
MTFIINQLWDFQIWEIKDLLEYCFIGDVGVFE